MIFPSIGFLTIKIPPQERQTEILKRYSSIKDIESAVVKIDNKNKSII